MTTNQELESKLWKALRSDSTVMLGLKSVENGHTRPMAAQIEDQSGPIWFFSSTETELTNKLGSGHDAVAVFAAKDHDLFATIEGRLTRDDDRTVIDRLWNSHIAAWYEGGKSDPKLALLRFDPTGAEVWLNESSFMASLKLALGADPKQTYKEKVGQIPLSSRS